MEAQAIIRNILHDGLDVRLHLDTQNPVHNLARRLARSIHGWKTLSPGRNPTIRGLVCDGSEGLGSLIIPNSRGIRANQKVSEAVDLRRDSIFRKAGTGRGALDFKWRRA